MKKINKFIWFSIHTKKNNKSFPFQIETDKQAKKKQKKTEEKKSQVVVFFFFCGDFLFLFLPTAK